MCKSVPLLVALFLVAAAPRPAQSEYVDQNFPGQPSNQVQSFLDFINAVYASPDDLFIGDFAPIDLAKLVGYALRRERQDHAYNFPVNDTPFFQQELREWVFRYGTPDRSSAQLWSIVVQAAGGAYDQEVESALHIKPLERQ